MDKYLAVIYKLDERIKTVEALTNERSKEIDKIDEEGDKKPLVVPV